MAGFDCRTLTEQAVGLYLLSKHGLGVHVKTLENWNTHL